MARVCSKCGKSLKVSDKFCDACGGKSVEKKASTTTANKCSCGAGLKAKDKFCGSCGKKVSAKKKNTKAAPPAPTCPSCGKRVKKNDRFCGECGETLTATTKLPAVALPTSTEFLPGLKVGAAALLSSVLLGAILSIVFLILPDRVMVFPYAGSFFQTTFQYAASLSLAWFHAEDLFNNQALRFLPAIFALLVPGFVSWKASAKFLKSSDSKILLAALAGVTFSLGLVIFRAFAGTPELFSGFQFDKLAVWPLLIFSFLQVFLVSLLASGYRLPRSKWVHIPRAALAALKPLMLAIIGMAAIGTAVVVLQTVRLDSIREVSGFPKQSQLAASIEQGLYAVERGVIYTELASGASFKATPSSFVVPVGAEGSEKLIFEAASQGETRYEFNYNLFDYYNVFSGPVGQVLIFILPTVMIMAALFAGFLLARELKPKEKWMGGISGLLLGPIWMAAVWALNLLTEKEMLASPVISSVNLHVLVGAAICGLLGSLSYVLFGAEKND